MGSAHKALLPHTQVQELPQGKALTYLCSELQAELAAFLHATPYLLERTTGRQAMIIQT